MAQLNYDALCIVFKEVNVIKQSSCDSELLILQLSYTLLDTKPTYAL